MDDRGFATRARIATIVNGITIRRTANGRTGPLQVIRQAQVYLKSVD